MLGLEMGKRPSFCRQFNHDRCRMLMIYLLVKLGNDDYRNIKSDYQIRFFYLSQCR